MTKITNFVWNSVDDCVISELDGANNVQAVYTNEPQQYGGVLSQRRGTTTSTYHADALGTTRFLTDSSGSVTDTYLHDAWGNEVASTGTTVNPFRWVGRYGYYRDASTELVYVRARMYMPIVARWASVDPLAVRPSDIQPYKYVLNSPTRLVDAEGLEVTVNHGFNRSGDYRCGDTIKAGWIFTIPSGAPALGYVIQRVTIRCTVSSCLFCPDQTVVTPSYEFYEAWNEVSAAEKVQVFDYGEGTFLQDTCGVFSAVGEIRFFFVNDYKDQRANRTYKGIGFLGNLPNDSYQRGTVHGRGKGCPTNTGDLLSSDQPPRPTWQFPDPPKQPDWENGMLLGRRNFSLYWNCCCAKFKFARLDVQ